MVIFVASHNSSDLKNCHTNSMTHPAGGLTLPPAALNAGQRHGTQAAAWAVNPCRPLPADRSTPPRRAGAGRAPGGAGARELAWGRQRQVQLPGRRLRIAAAAAGLSCGESAVWSCVRVCLSIRLRSTAGTAWAALPCTQSHGRTTLRGSRPGRSSSRPRSGTLSPGADPRCTHGTAGPCRGNPVRPGHPRCRGR